MKISLTALCFILFKLSFNKAPSLSSEISAKVDDRVSTFSAERRRWHSGQTQSEVFTDTCELISPAHLK